MNNDDTFTAMLADLHGPLTFGRKTNGFPASVQSPITFNMFRGTPRKPFDDTVLNINDEIIKKHRKRETLHDSTLNESDDIDDTLGTPWEQKFCNTELTQAYERIGLLESNINHMHTERKELEDIFEHEKSSLKVFLDQERNLVNELKKRVTALSRKEENFEKELKEVLSKAHDEMKDSEFKAKDFQEENMTLKEMLSTIETEKKDSDIKLKNVLLESEKLENQLKLATDNLNKVNDQMAQLKWALKDFDKNKASLTTAQHKIKELESEIKIHNDSATLFKVQQVKLAKYGEMEKQLNSLIHRNANSRETTNTCQLENIVRELHSRFEMSEKSDRQLSEATNELEKLRINLGEYKKLSEGILGPTTSTTDFSNYVYKLKNDNLNTFNELSQIQSKLNSLEETAKETEKYKQEIDKLKKELEACSSSLKRLKKQNAIVTWERNDLRSLIDSCQRDVTMVGMSDPRLESLEKLVSTYRTRLEQIESNPSSLEMPMSPPEKFNIVELEKLKAENKELKDQVEKYEYEIAHRAIKGDFNTKNTKILHLKMNPSSEAIAQYENDVDVLRKENIKLKERLKLIQKGEADITQNLANLINNDNSKECQELKEKVKSQELQNQRLKEVFRKSLQDFREAIFSLFGYKVDALSNKNYRLTSLYAEAETDNLLFKLSTQDKMEMLETEFSKTLSELINLTLIQHNSIPMFLSMLTVDLFKRQTFSVLESTVQEQTSIVL